MSVLPRRQCKLYSRNGRGQLSYPPQAVTVSEQQPERLGGDLPTQPLFSGLNTKFVASNAFRCKRPVKSCP